MAGRLKILVAFLALVASCKKAEKLQSDLTLSSTFEIIQGDGQVVLPKRDLPQPIIVKVTSKDQKPLTDAQVSFCLADLSNGVSVESTSLDELIQRCQVVKGALRGLINLVTPKEGDLGAKNGVKQTPEDRVGAIIQASSTTGISGEASVLLRAPSMYGKKIGLLVVIGDLTGPLMGTIATFSTPFFGNGDSFSLESSGQGREKAGASFTLLIKAVDPEGLLISDFVGVRKFSIKNFVGPSWAGLQSKLPQDNFSCNFSGGRCVVPGGPWFISPAGKTSLKLVDLGDQGQKEQENSFNYEVDVQINLDGHGQSVVIADRVDLEGSSGGKGAVPISDVTLNPGDRMTLAAYLTDAGGNRIKLANDALWTVSNPNLNKSVPTKTTGSFEFVSNISGTGKITAIVSGAKDNPIPIKIRPGSLDHWVVSSEHNGIEEAGVCFGLAIKGVDDKSNVIEDLDGSWQLILGIEGISESGAAVAEVAHFKVLGSAFGKTIPTVATLSKGVASLAPKACFFDATDVSPKITVLSQTKTVPPIDVRGELPIKVLLGKPAGLGLLTAPLSQTDQNLARNPCNPGLDTYDNPCIALSVDDQGGRYYVIVTDLGGNAIQGTGATWSVSGPLASALNGKYFSDYAPISPTQSGRGVLQVTSPEGIFLRKNYMVAHGVPKQFVVVSEHNNRESAVVPFGVTLKALDQFGNSCDTFSSGLSFVFSLDRALNSPSPIIAQPSAPFTENILFNKGIGKSLGKLQAPYASNQPGILAPQKPRVKIATQTSTFYSEDIHIIPGPAKQVKFRSVSGGGGSEIMAPIGIRQDLQLPLYIASYDEVGNYVEDTFAKFTTTGVLTGTLVTSEGPTTTIVPKDVGVGSITATPNNLQLSPITIDPISVSASKAVRLAITTSHNQAEIAAVPFTITITAFDRDGNPDPNYIGNKTLKFEPITSKSWAGDSSFFTDGLCGVYVYRGSLHLK